MSKPNYAGNIIVILANLPEFLRTPILKKRLLEFFSLSEIDRAEMINNALEAGPTIPFSNFAKLFKTWLEVLTTMSEEQRNLIFSNYVNKIVEDPRKIINYNLDGIFEIFMNLDEPKKEIISNSLKMVLSKIESEEKRKILLLIPDMAKKQLGI